MATRTSVRAWAFISSSSTRLQGGYASDRGRLHRARETGRRSAETEAQIEAYWKFGCRVLNLPGSDILDGLKAAGRPKSIGVPTP